MSDDEVTQAIIQVYVSPLVAGIFALVLYAIFLTEIITGALFPAFKGTEATYDSVRQLLIGITPDQRLDAAKALLWAFIAGFSERMVPNILDRLVERSVEGNGDSV